MSPLRRGACLAVLVALLHAPPATAEEVTLPVAGPVFDTMCIPDDPVLEELSGLAAVGGRLFATPDAGPDERIVELDERCSVVARIDPPVDPYDVEDLAAGPDGRLWLGDVGDNSHVRETVALISVDPDTGDGALHRLTYPDGARDAETVLISPSGDIVIVTKALFGPSNIYRPARGRTIDDLPSPGPTPLEKVGTLALGPSDTAGGPIPGASSSMITGGAVGADGTVVAIRTYTDVYLFDAPDADIAAALLTEPRYRIPVPDEPQGEAVAFSADGDLLTASERGAARSAVGTALPPIRILPGAEDLLAPTAADDNGDEASNSVLQVVGVAAGAALVLGVAAWVVGRRRGR